MEFTTENIIMIVAGLIILSAVNTMFKETLGKLAAPLTIFAVLCIATGVVSVDTVVEYTTTALSFLVEIITKIFDAVMGNMGGGTPPSGI